MKRTREEVREAILMALEDGKPYSFGSLERKAGTNWKTIRDHCKELELFEVVKITKEGVEITQFGKKILKKLLQR